MPNDLIIRAETEADLGPGEQQQNWEVCQYPISFCTFSFRIASLETGVPLSRVGSRAGLL